MRLVSFDAAQLVLTPSIAAFTAAREATQLGASVTNVEEYEAAVSGAREVAAILLKNVAQAKLKQGPESDVWSELLPLPLSTHW